MSKGDNRRPTDDEKFGRNYDQINWDSEQVAPAQQDDKQIPIPFRRPRPKIVRNRDG